jgi:CubicO group peptidase (beta-lactamase class C family)
MVTNWTRATPEAAGFAANLERKLAAGFESGLLLPIHALLVSRGGKLVLEQYFEGEDESWGDPLGPVQFGPTVLHDLRSVTKSIVGLLYGIALERGLVPALDAPVIDGFPEYPDLVADPERRKVTVAHTLTMTTGMEWDENKPYTDPTNSEIAMEMAPDRYRFILDRPIIGAPGEKWIYSGGAVALIGALIERGSGQKLPDFAREALFAPLGISDFYWLAGSDGVASPASGLRLTAPDLLRIGAMLVDGGRHEGRQVVPAAWIDASWTPAIQTWDGLGYGRLWYIHEAPAPGYDEPLRWVGAFGNGGQRLWLAPEAGLACVINAGDYNKFDRWVTPARIWREIVVGNLVRA